MSTSTSTSTSTEHPTDLTARPVRMCDTCGGVDDHPRHVVGRGADDAEPTTPAVAAVAVRNADPDDLELVMAQVQDDSTVVKHMDCCRADGCPDGTCDLVTAGYRDLRGDALVEILTSTPTTSTPTTSTEA